ncbi:MLO-like protein 9 [Rutidosis leptorrhynchoides]|uniref:MLO-like protein 9 n=1 Tax=Rutidosis leptorrhynchoides TaxID=125765 RepID=UPI003A992308
MAGGGRGLDETATWSVAMVCAIIVILSIMLEKILHHIGHYLKERHKNGLLEALEKIKTELMILGFISLLLTFCQNYIAAVCVSKVLTKDFLPCKKRPDIEPTADDDDDAEADTRRKLLWYNHSRRLAGDGPPKECKPGYEALITVSGLHQLHIFIFFLAVFHVIYSALTMIAGRKKIREWKSWEKDILQQQAAAHDPSRFRLTKETSFVKGHATGTGFPIVFYVVCFFRQFFTSVGRSDYLTMRHGFISVHLAPGSQFNFQKYIKRSLEDDFKVIVGISPLLWSTAVLYLFANVQGTHAMVWLSLFPVVIILAVGTKLQAIIAQMATEIQERQSVIQGIPLVQVTDKHFWFQDPTLILYLIQLTLFMNSFEITHFFWIWYEFGLDSCFHEKPVLQYGRVLIGMAVQVLCSYGILPLYALITQMGSKMKRSIFDDQTSKALKSWHKHATKKRSQSGRLPTKSLKLNSQSGNAQAHVAPPNTATNSPTVAASVEIQQDKQKSSSSSTTPNLL